MNRQNNVPYNRPAMANEAKPAPAYTIQQQPPPGRVPQEFREAMIHIPVKPAAGNSNIRTTAAKPQPAKKRPVKPSADKWKSSFKPLGEEDDAPEQSTGGSAKDEIYDPYDPISSDSELEMPRAQHRNRSPVDQDNNLERHRLSPGRGSSKKCRWGSNYSESTGQPLNSRDLSPETRPTESRGLSPGHGLPERPGYDPAGRPLDHRVHSPDRPIHCSSSQCFPESYGGQRTNGEERMTIPEYRREMNTVVRLSPPRLHRDYQHQVEYEETELDQVSPDTEEPRNRSMSIIMNKKPITCDLCDIELASGRELEDHLDSKSHWDTLEHIQEHKDYDDLVIAFLQEVMLYKSHQCSRAIEDSALQALQENDHMTKVEMFHCAACSVFVSTSASSVQSHITSKEHLANTQEFQVQQRHSCLDKAETMMRVLKPQFELFLEGRSPFE